MWKWISYLLFSFSVGILVVLLLLVVILSRDIKVSQSSRQDTLSLTLLLIFLTGACSLFTDSFSQLADLLLQFPSILKFSHFVFVPGPSDPFNSPLLPRASIPEILITRLRNRLGPRAQLHFTSNPCRIRYFGQEIVVYRDDVMSRMLRNTVRMKQEPKEIDLKKYVSIVCKVEEAENTADQQYETAADLLSLPSSIRSVLFSARFDALGSSSSLPFNSTSQTCSLGV